MSGVTAALPLYQFSSALGVPVASGKLYTYVAGSTTPAATYSDPDLAPGHANTNPIILDSSGQAVIWMDPAVSYKWELKTSAGVTVPGWPVDNISGAASSIDVAADIAALLASFAASSGASLVGWDNGGTAITVEQGLDILYYGVANIRNPRFAGGAVGDGVADDTAAVQAAIDSGAMFIHVPAVDVAYRLTSPISISTPVTVLGAGTSPYGAIGPYDSHGLGSWFFLDHPGVGFYAYNGGDSLTTIRYTGIGTYRNHTNVIGPGWTPTVFDFDFVGEEAEIFYSDVVLLNAYKGILHTAESVRSNFDNVRGQWFHIGIDIQVAMDVVRISNIHHWPFWQNDADVLSWMRSNTTNIALSRCDNPMLSNCFSFGANIGIGIYQGALGTVSKLKAVNIDMDLCNQPLYVDSAVNDASGQFTNFTCYGPSTASTDNYGLRILGDFCNFDFVNLEGSNLSRGLVRVEGTGNTTRLQGVRAKEWNRFGAGSAVLDNGVSNTMYLVDKLETSGSGTIKLANAGVFKAPQECSVGVGVILNGSTSVAVTHGLPITPTPQQISVWSVTGVGAAKQVWLDASSITSTQFTIKCDVDPTVNISAGWRAALE